MLYDLETTRIVTETLQSYFKLGVTVAIPPMICDPVCISTSGHTILQRDAIEFMITRLFPMATVITPNITEAQLLLAQKGIFKIIQTLDGMLVAADLLLSSVGSHAVLLKGGHITATMRDVMMISEKHSDIQIVKHGLYGENMEILLARYQDLYPELKLVVDILHQRSGEKTMFVRPRINSSTSTHGAGCTLSSAIACEIALGCNCMYDIQPIQFFFSALINYVSERSRQESNRLYASWN